MRLLKRNLVAPCVGDIRPKIMGREYNTMDPKEMQKFLEDDGTRKCRVPPEKAARIAASIMLEK